MVIINIGGKYKKIFFFEIFFELLYNFFFDGYTT